MKNLLYPLLIITAAWLFPPKSQAQLTGITPNTAEPGETLTTTVTGNGIFFAGATFNMWLEQASTSTYIYADAAAVALDANTGIVDFTIPVAAPPGFYTVVADVWDPFWGFSQIYSLTNGFMVGAQDAYMTGAVYFDENGNGMKDAGEIPLPNQHITIEPYGLVVLTNANGEYSFGGLFDSTYTIGVEPQPGWSLSSTSSSYAITLTGNVGDLDFGLSGPPPYINIEAAFAWQAPTCNQVRTYTLNVWNTGSAIAENNVVQYTFPATFTFFAAAPVPDLVSGNTLTWYIDTLAPFSLFQPAVALQVAPSGTITHALLAFGESTSLSESDTATALLNQSVTCGFDPNDKTANADSIEFDNVPIDYTIRFQNTGTDTAFDVTVRDTLSALLDINTVELLFTDHAVSVQLDPVSNSIAFVFDNILLPDSNTNEPESHGTITYRVMPLAGMPIGSEIHNTAAIYFDLNEPVITNDALVLFCNKDTTQNPLTICEGDSALVDGQYFSQAGTYYTHSSTPTVCDLVTVTVLTVNPASASASLSGSTLTASAGDAFQWIDCTSGLDVPGETSQTFTPSVSGQYAVVITTAQGCAVQSACVNVLLGGACPAVSGVSVDNVTANGATVNWNSADGAAKYRVRVRKLGQTGYTNLFFVNAPDTAKALLNLAPNSHYLVRIRTQCSTNGSTLSQWSAPVYFTTPAASGVCVAPVDLTATPATTTAAISWTPVSGSNGYQLRYRVSGTLGWTPVVINNGVANGYELTGLQAGESYDYQVRTKCDVSPLSWSTYTEIQTFATAARLGGDAAAKTTLSVYPNPAGQFTNVVVFASQASDASVRVMSADGRMIFENAVDVNKGENEILLNTAQLTSGVYVVEVRIGQLLYGNAKLTVIK